MKVYVTVTAPDEVATVPLATAELRPTLNDAAKLAFVRPVVAVTVSVGSEPEDGPPVTVKMSLARDHVTPAGPAGTKVTFTVFVPVKAPNW